MRIIKKKSVVNLPNVSGAVSDTLNVTDKITNAPSINLVQQMVGIPYDGIIQYDGDEIPEGYIEVESPNILPTKVKVLYDAFEAMDFSIPDSWAVYDLSDSLDNYDAILTQFFYTHSNYTNGYLVLHSTFDYIQHITAFIDCTISHWDTASEYSIQSLSYQIYGSKTTHSQIQVQHCNCMTISPNGNTLKTSRMGIARIIGYKF